MHRSALPALLPSNLSGSRYLGPLFSTHMKTWSCSNTVAQGYAFAYLFVSISPHGHSVIVVSNDAHIIGCTSFVVQGIQGALSFEGADVIIRFKRCECNNPASFFQGPHTMGKNRSREPLA